MTCCIKTEPMCFQSLSFECSLDRVLYHDSRVRKNTTIILIMHRAQGITLEESKLFLCVTTILQPVISNFVRRYTLFFSKLNYVGSLGGDNFCFKGYSS